MWFNTIKTKKNDPTVDSGVAARLNAVAERLERVTQDLENRLAEMRETTEEPS